MADGTPSVKARKTRIELADGRELIYYDEDPASRRETVDSRRLPETIVQSEVRRDPLRDEWVIIASHRQGRTHLPPAESCPLCPTDFYLFRIADRRERVVVQIQSNLSCGHRRTLAQVL